MPRSAFDSPDTRPAASGVARARASLQAATAGWLLSALAVAALLTLFGGPARADGFTALGPTTTLYENARFGTRIEYDPTLFLPRPPPENRDGRSFRATDGQAGFIVFGQHDVFGFDAGERMREDIARGAFDTVSYREQGADWYVFSGLRGDEIVYRRVIRDRQDDVIHVFEITYPQAQRALYDEPVRRMSLSLAAPDRGSANGAVPLTGAVSSAEGEDFNGVMPMPEPSPAPAHPLPPPPPPDPGAYSTPAPGTQLRRDLMDGARGPIVEALGQDVVFVVETLRVHRDWAFLMAVPHRPDGRPLDWTSTPYADAWRADAMSDLVMVLMTRDGGGWRALAHVIGPTDVHWIGWMDEYGLPAALFSEH